MRAFCTIVSPSHIGPAQALAASLSGAGNPESLYVLVLGDPDYVQPGFPGIIWVKLADLPASFPPLMPHYFDAFELCCALKPYLVTYLFETIGATEAIYLDSDIMVTGVFTEVWSRLAAHSLLLTPHVLQPPSAGATHIRELDLLDLGFLNGGFAAWRAGQGASTILNWMRARFPVYGFCDRAAGMFVDQRLLPLLLNYFPEDVAVLRDPCLNVAYWNAHERPVERSEAHWSIAGRPVVFFHLSGYRPFAPEKPSAYLNPSANGELQRLAPWLMEVVRAYDRLLRSTAPSATPVGYVYDSYEGVRLNPRFRRILFREGRIDWKAPECWWIWLLERFRALKRRVVASFMKH